MIRSCVIGWPINHSRSPIIHNYWLKQHGIAGSYTRQPVEPAALAGFIAHLKHNGYAGCNVTLPHKEAVFSMVTCADEATLRLGAVNTVYVRDGQIFGTNTDGEGFISNLRDTVPAMNLKDQRAMILGAGGASLAVVNSILEQGAAEIVVTNRTLEKAQNLRRQFGSRITPIAWDRAAEELADCSLLVNTTSLGMKGQPALMLDLKRLPEKAIVADIVYTPLRTGLLKDAAQRGNTVVEGLGMLLHQAVRGFSLWFGQTPVVTKELHDLVARDIDPDYKP